MSNQMNTEELKTIIAAKIKEIGLNDVLDAAAIEKIKNKIMGVYNHEQAQNSIPSVIPEATVAGLGTSETGIFPGGSFGVGETTGNTSTVNATSVEQPIDNYDSTMQPGQNVDAGTTGNIPAYTPELPSFMDKIEPAKVIIFSQNELSEGGENLTNKPLRTFEDPDVKKSMNDFWLDKGQKKADVYMAKLEKIGELEFNYANGTTVFTEKRFEPDFEAQAKYKENPYMADNAGPATPGALDINGQPNVMAQIDSSVDIQQVVTDIVMNILRNQMLTNTTRAVDGTSQIKIDNKTEGMGYDTTQAVKPMEEGFSIKMIDLVNEYEKIDAPAVLKEAIEKNDKKFLVNENEEVQEWTLDGKNYYTPVVKMSTKKCYIK
jgi:hypothetical protein